MNLWRGGLSYRRLGVLIAALPPESQTKTAVRDSLTTEELAERAPDDDSHGRWSNTELLLAAVADGVNILAWQQGQINGGKKSPPPDPIRRPGVGASTERVLSSKARDHLQGIRDERRASATEGEGID